MPPFLYHKPMRALAWTTLILCSLSIPTTTTTTTTTGILQSPSPPSLSNNLYHRRFKRQSPDSSPILGPLLDSPNPSSKDPKPSPTSPAPDSSPSPSPKDPSKDSASNPLLPLLGSPFSIPTTSSSPAPTPSPSPTPGGGPNNNSTNPTSVVSPTNSTSSSPITPSPSSNSSSPLPGRPGVPANINNNPSSNASLTPLPSTTATPKQPPSHKPEDDSSSVGSTTIKFMAITAGIVAGLFLLWTIIRKWKFRPSKRFAKKLDTFDDDVFAPRPPSFGEKRPTDYQAYSIPVLPQGVPPAALGTHYPPYSLGRNPTAPNPVYGTDMKGPETYPQPRTSDSSVTKPPAMFEPNPYRLSLGFEHGRPSTDFNSTAS